MQGDDYWRRIDQLGFFLAFIAFRDFFIEANGNFDSFRQGDGFFRIFFMENPLFDFLGARKFLVQIECFQPIRLNRSLGRFSWFQSFPRR